MKKFIPIFLSCLTITSCSAFLPKGVEDYGPQSYFIDYKDSKCSHSDVSIELYLGLWNQDTYDKEWNNRVNAIIFLNMLRDIGYTNDSIILKEIPLSDASRDDYCFEKELVWGGMLTSDWYIKIKYSTTVFVTIPLEMFTKNEGDFAIACTSKDLENDSIGNIVRGKYFKYSKTNGKVSIEESSI